MPPQDQQDLQRIGEAKIANLVAATETLLADVENTSEEQKVFITDVNDDLDRITDTLEQGLPTIDRAETETLRELDTLIIDTAEIIGRSTSLSNIEEIEDEIEHELNQG